MTTAVRTMPRPKDTSKLEGVKIRKDVLDRARISFTWIKSKMENPTNFTLASYLSDCLEGKRSFIDDYASYIREESKRLGK